MNQRREPTISPVAGDSSSRRTQTNARSAARENGRIAPPVKQSSGGSALAATALVLSVVGIALAAYAFVHANSANQELALSKMQLLKAEERVAELEKKLSIADGESTQSLTALNAKVKENLSEIRKLWAIAYDRNRKAIAELQAESKKTKASLDKTAKNASAEQKRLTERVSTVSAMIDELKRKNESYADSLANAAAGNEGLLAQIGGMESRVNVMEQQLLQRIQDSEDEIRSIDAFRLQVNRDLLSLKEWTNKQSSLN